MSDNEYYEDEKVYYRLYGEGCEKTEELLKLLKESDVEYFYREIGKDCDISELYKIAYRPDCVLPLVRKSGGKIMDTTDELWLDINRDK